jgi:SNF2 family DNA or RNA helicase
MLRTSLYKPYQTDGVKWMVTRELLGKHPGGFLCDEMGLGKTVQTIATMVYNRVPHTLIIVPNSIVHQWIDEIKTHSSLTVSVFRGEQSTDVSITTYSALVETSKMYPHILETKWDRVVLDEAHELRNPGSKRFKTLIKMNMKVRWLLTGTPVYNSERDFKALIRILTNDWFFQESKRDVILRRTKTDLVSFNKALELPPCHFEHVELERYPEEETGYNALFNLYVNRILADETSNMLVLEGFLRLRQFSIHPDLCNRAVFKTDYTGNSKKLETLKQLISEHPDEKTLIFCQFKKEMKIIQNMLDAKCFVLDGDVDSDQRRHVIKRFKRYHTGCVFLIQIKAGGQGLNLQEASRVYITSPSWNPATELQAISRSHRGGQQKPVYVKKLIYVAPSTIPSIDESIVELQDHKSFVCSEVLNDPRVAEQLPKLKKRNMVKLLRKFFEC